MTAVALAEPLSPELALVCPELRERALALLPEAPWLRPSVAGAAPARAAAAPLSPLPVRIAVYATARAATTAAEGAVFAGAVAGVVLGLSVVA